LGSISAFAFRNRETKKSIKEINTVRKIKELNALRK